MQGVVWQIELAISEWMRTVCRTNNADPFLLVLIEATDGRGVRTGISMT